MVTLNLLAMTADEVVMKDYLENTVSEELAAKINNGVQIEKDGKFLTNKKSLQHFINFYAAEQAHKLLQQGAKGVGVYKDAIFAWLITYFQDDSVQGKLYNLDGTEYQPPKPKATIPTATATKKPAAVIPAKPKPMTLFDMMANQEQQAKLAEFEAGEPEVAVIEEQEQESDEIELTEEEQNDALDELAKEEQSIETQSIKPEAAPEVVKQPVSEVKPVSTEDKLRETIAARYPHPLNNIIVCGMPPAVKSTSSNTETIPSDVDKKNLIQVNETHCADKITGEVYERPASKAVPDFIISLFGNALKVEVV